MFETLTPVVVPVAIAIAIGYVWKKAQWPYNTDMVSRLIMWVGAPCLIVSVLVESDVSQAVLEQMFWVSLCLLGVTAFVGLVILLTFKLPVRNFLVPLVFPNAGNMGLPVCLFAFGDQGLVYALAIFMVFSFLHFTVGMALLSGQSVVKETFRNPIIWAILLALYLIYGQISLPFWAQNTVANLGGFTIPLMLITLGVSLADLSLNNFFKGAVLALLRLLIGVAVGWGVAESFGLQGVAKGVTILQSAMPVAVFNYLFALRYSRDPQTVASMVFVSTLASFILIPAVLLYII